MKTAITALLSQWSFRSRAAQDIPFLTSRRESIITPARCIPLFMRMRRVSAQSAE